MVADLWLVHLEKLFKQLAQADNWLRMWTDWMEVTKVLAVERSENKITVFFGVGDKTKWKCPWWESFDWDNTTWREGSNNFVSTRSTNYRSIRFWFYQIKDLSISVECHDHGLNHFLEDEIFVIITRMHQVCHWEVISGCFKLIELFLELTEIV